MKAIQTKYLPATNTKEARIKAMIEGGHSIVIKYKHYFFGVYSHRKAATELCKKLAFDVDIVGGELPNHDYCWVIIQKV